MKLVFALLLISCGAWDENAGAAQPETAARVRALVRQLDDDEESQRQRAEEALIEMGIEILAWLPRDASGMTAESRQRLARVRSQLQLAWARRAVEASPVTLQGTMDVAAALQRLQQSSGNAIGGSAAFAERPIDIDAREMPFWQVLDRVLDQAGLTIYPYSAEQGALRVVARGPEQARRVGRACYVGLLRIEPTYVSSVQDLLQPSLKALRVRLAMAWEPKTKPISLSLPLADIQGRDDLGNPIRADQALGRLYAAVESDVPVVEMELPLTLPPRTAKAITSLQGTIEALIPGQLEDFEFPDLDTTETQHQRRAGATVSLIPPRTNDDKYEVTVHVEFDEAFGALESHRGWIYRNEAYMVDTEGRRQEHGGRRLVSQHDKGMRMTFLFALDQPLSHYKLIYRTPSLMIRQPMRFELSNIDLP